jgi:quercetin dioxygenase-like cupin family protein
MVIKEVLAQLETATHPVAKALHSGAHFKVLVLAFKAGMHLKEHKTHLPAKLTVFSGTVIYREGSKELTLNTYDTTDIHVDVTHSVEALEDSLCLLTQG